MFGGLGYKVFMSETSIENVGNVGDVVKVHTHYRVREDDISIYGFLSNEELKMFELLLQVSGIGAKTAIVALSHISASQFALAVISNDISKLTKIPGIGNKSAQRIVLELKDKLKTEDGISTSQEPEETVVDAEVADEAMQALQILGYNKNDITKTFKKMKIANLSTEDIIKEALKFLSR